MAGRKTFLLAIAAAGLGFTAGCVLGGLAAAFRGTWIDRVCVTAAVAGVSIPHYWLGMVLVIIFSVQLNLLPAMGAGGGGAGEWAWDWAHIQFLILPAVTLSVIPAGIITRTVRGSRDRDPEPGLRHHPARQGPAARRRPAARAEERRAHGTGRDGPAARLPHGRIDPGRNSVQLAGHGHDPKQRDLPA